MEEGRGTHFDPRVLDAFLACREAIVEVRMEYIDVEQRGVATEICMWVMILLPLTAAILGAFGLLGGRLGVSPRCAAGGAQHPDASRTVPRIGAPAVQKTGGAGRSAV